MEHNVTVSGQLSTVKLSGQFTFEDAVKFKDMLELTRDKRFRNINIDFSDVSFIDSSGMGMLLLLRDQCRNNDISLNLINPRGQVEQIFKISRFYDLFSIAA